ncbi:MAG: hypothetical protein PHQ74_05370 [Crocinitomicaceae bacterium]|nr:hypothetical protein [Crocinitomicaceae bacterium]
METIRLILDIIIILLGCYWIFIKSYYTEKGKNLATKEDIKDITDKIESVKLDYLKLFEDYKKDLNLKNELEKTLINPKFTDVYRLVTSTKEIIFKRQNKLAGEEIMEQLFNNIREIITIIPAQVQLKDKLNEEVNALADWNNEFVLYVDELKRNGKTQYEMNCESIMKIMDDMQTKIMK